MTDADTSDGTDYTPPVDESHAATAATVGETSDVDEQKSDFWHSVTLIRPVLSLPSMSSIAVLELYQHQQQQQRQQQQKEQNEHDPSKQLVLYEPTQQPPTLAQLAAMGNGRRAALRRVEAHMAKNGERGLYEWGEISDNSGSNAMQT